MSVGALDTAVSGLLAFQQSLATTSHNISNVNTEGYSRQRAELVTRPAISIGAAGYLGNGVRVALIERTFDDFLTAQLNASTAAAGQLKAYNELISEIDNFIADPDASVPNAMQNFFGSIHDLVNDPSSITVRQALLSSARTLVGRFTTISTQLDEIRDKTNRAMTDSVALINALTANLAELNQRVLDSRQTGSGTGSNDLQDQRDLALSKLAEQVDVQLIVDNLGNYNVLTSTGQALVMASVSNELGLTAARFPGGPLEVMLTPFGSKASINISNQVAGGALGGYRQFIDEVLNPVQNDVGRIAVAFAHQINQQLQTGFDLNGNPGAAMFSEPPTTVIASANNAATTPPIGVTIGNHAALTGSDYQINVTATGTVVMNLRTQQVSQFGGAASVQFSLDGLDFDLTGTSVGDSFLIQPTRSAASGLTLELDVINGAAQIGAAASAGAVGDNANALLLAGLQTLKTSLKQGSYEDAYNEVVGRVGVLTQSSNTDSKAQRKLLEVVKAQRDAVSGVNLDEEAANLITFQQAYQASAQVISIVRTTFDALIAAVK